MEAPASSSTTPAAPLPKRYSLLPPSTKPSPESSTTAVLPSPDTDCTCTSVTVGTICSATLAPLPSPTRRTLPVTASSGTFTCACVAEALTVAGRTMRSLRLPLASMVWKTMSRLVSKPAPVSVIVWPGLAEAPPPAAVPAVAVALMPVRASPKAALVPPTVETRIGPVGTPSGTLR